MAPGVNPSFPTNAKTSQLAAPGDSGSIDARNSAIGRELRDCIAGHTYKLYSFIYIDKPAAVRFAHSRILVALSVYLVSTHHIFFMKELKSKLK